MGTKLRAVFIGASHMFCLREYLICMSRKARL